MNATSRLERAKQYLAIAEAEDAKRDAYMKAAEEIKAARELEGATWAQIASALGRSTTYTRRLVDWANDGAREALPFIEPGARRLTRDGIPAAMANPARRAEILARLSATELATFAAEALAVEEVMAELARITPETVRQMEATLVERHIANHANPLPDEFVSKPQLGFRVELSRPLGLLQCAADELVHRWNMGVEDARSVEVEFVRDAIAGVIAQLETAITSMEVPS